MCYNFASDDLFGRASLLPSEAMDDLASFLIEVPVDVDVEVHCVGRETIKQAVGDEV